MREFEKSVFFKISNKRLVDIIELILFINRIINREIDIIKDKKYIILLLIILNNSINFELNIKFRTVLKKIEYELNLINYRYKN